MGIPFYACPSLEEATVQREEREVGGRKGYIPGTIVPAGLPPGGVPIDGLALGGAVVGTANVGLGTS